MKNKYPRTLSQKKKALTHGAKAACAALLLSLAGTSHSWAGLMDSPAGGTLPDTITPVGGIVVDIVGRNGTRLLAYVDPSTLTNSTTTEASLLTIGTATGFSQALINSLGGGISSASIRISLWDGDNSPGDGWYGDNWLTINGVSYGNFSTVATVETSDTGIPYASGTSYYISTSGASVVATGTGFKASVLDTGYFAISGSTALASFYSALKTGTLTFAMGDSFGGNVVDFKYVYAGSQYEYVGYLPGINSPTLVLSNTWNTPTSLDYVAKYNTITTEDCTIKSLTFTPGSTLTLAGTMNLLSGTISTQSGGSSVISGGAIQGYYGVGNLTFNMAGDQVVSSVIIGEGDLIKTGTATLTLIGANTYTGETVINAGNLVIGDGSSGTISTTSGITISGSGALLLNLPQNTISYPDIQNDGSVQIIGGNTTAIAGVISGTGAFYHNGIGTTYLLGENTYTGATVVNAGILYIGDGSEGSVSASSPLSVGQAGTLVLAAAPGDSIWSRSFASDGTVVLLGTSSSYTYSGSISGAGSLIKWGDSTVLLNAAQTYTGTTRVGQGTLIFGASNLLASQSALEVDSGAVLDMGNYSLAISQVSGGGTILTGSSSVLTVGVNDGSSTFAGAISGSGSLVKTGAGTWTIAGTENAAGGITIDAGTLVVSGSAGGNVAVNSGAELLVTGAVGGNVESAGTLVINGRLDGNVDVAGYLGGSGLIVGDVTNHAVVSPGNSPGILTISGNYTQTSAGSLYMQIASPTLYDKLVISGSAILDGSLVVTSQRQIRTEYTILTAGAGISGTFSNLVADAYMKFYLVYNADSVTLEPFYRYLSVVPGLTPNEYAVAKALDKAMDSPKFYNNSKLLTLGNYLNALPDKSLPAAFEMMVPTDYVILPDATFSLARVQTSNLELRMEQIRTDYADYTACVDASRVTNDGTHYIDAQGRDITPVPIDRGWSFFMNGSGDFVSVKPSSTYSDGKYNTGGVSAGADYRWDSIDLPCAAGLTVGYANTSLTGRGDGHADIDSGDISGYFTAFKNGYFVNGILGGGMANYDLKRESLGGSARGSTSGMNLNASIGGGYSYAVNGFSAGPIASLRYTGVQIDSFTERGSLSPLDIHEQNKNSIQSTAGFQVSYEFPVETVLIKPHARVQWRHEYANDSRDVTASFQTGEAFTVNGESVGSDSLLLDLGATVRFTPMISAYAYYLGDLGSSNYTSNAVIGGMQLSF